MERNKVGKYKRTNSIRAKISRGLVNYFSNPESRRKMSELQKKLGTIPPSRKGIPCSDAQKKKISDALKGRKVKEKVGYRAIHYWVTSIYGKPDKCEECLTEGLSGKKIHWANISGKYKRNREDWKRLCAKCHNYYDRVTKKS